MLGMHGTIYANYAVNDADLLLALGVRFDDRVTGKLTEFAKHGRIVHVEIDASEINKNKYAHIPVHTDVRAFLEAINPLVGPGNWRAWHQQIDEWRTAEPMTYDQRDDVILPQYVLEQFSKLTKGEFLMSTGVGQHQMWAAQWTGFKHPRTWITSGGLGSMGYGLPAAMGAQAAFPEALVVDIDGDGSFLMNIQELATCAQNEIPVKVFVMNNGYLGMVRQWQELFWDGRYSQVDTGDFPDFVKLVEACGGSGFRFEDKGTLVGDMRRAIETPGLVLADVRVTREENTYPMIAPGAAARDMVG